MNLLQRLLKAREEDRIGHLDKEKLKRGVLRAGSTGMLSSEGEVVGACHRVSLLRSKGVEVDPPSASALIMFELGYANEDVIYKSLVSSLLEGESVKREEEIPISWTTSNGTLVTGRPDIAVLDSTGKITMGIELKSVHSMWTARDVLFGRKPKLPNLAQAAHYMWKLGLQDYKLMYKSYSQLGQGMVGTDNWVSRMLPKHGDEGSEYIEYSEDTSGKFTIKHIKQFEIVYDLMFDKHGRLLYRVEGVKTPWNTTILTRQGIEAYFELVSKMEATKNLGPRPSAIDALGKKLSYSACKYCPLNQTCTTFQKAGYDKWMVEVLKTVEENKKALAESKKFR